MEELQRIAKDLRACYEEKKSKAFKDKVPNSHVIGLLKNRENDVISFEKAINEISNDPTVKNQIIKNFSQESEDIKKRLDEL